MKKESWNFNYKKSIIASSQLAQSEDNNDEDTPGGAMGDHSREGSDFPGDHPFDEDPLTGDPDKPGRLGLGTITGGNPGELLCNLGNEPFSSNDDDVEC